MQNYFPNEESCKEVAIHSLSESELKKKREGDSNHC